MKAVIISLILTLILVAAIITNAIYISRVSEEMKSLITQISQGEAVNKAFEELNAIWSRHKNFFTISVGFEEIDHITEYITRLGCAIESNNTADIRLSCALLKNFFDDVTRHERVSPINIF